MKLYQPILEHRGHRYVDRYGRKRGVWIVGVYCCPDDSTKYSFDYSDGGGVCVFEEYKENRYLSGRFDTPEEALEEGLRFGVEERRRMRGNG